MLRGYRSIILALGLILAFALPSGQGSQAQQADPQQKISQPLERIANALDQANEPKRETADCAEGSNDRKSDLCAQWKAADAAKQAANAADWTVTVAWVGVALGAITMGAAIAAAKFAYDAAVHTRDANDIARAEQRPWIAIQVEPSSALMLHVGQADLGVNVALKNCGKRVATDLIASGAMFSGSTKASERTAIVEELRATVQMKQSETDYNRRIVLPGEFAGVAIGLKCPPVAEAVYRIIVYLEYKIEGTGEFKYSWASFDIFQLKHGQIGTVKLAGIPISKKEIQIAASGVGAAN
jgi:hypothetical protein